MDHKLPTYEDLVSAIESFNKAFPRPGMKVVLGDKFDLSKDYNNLSDWYDGKVGVYVLLNDECEVVRVGSTTENLYSRLNSYFDYKDHKEDAGTGCWKEGVSSKYICVCVVPKEQVFEALAIEKYLLMSLTPPLNKEGMVKNIKGEPKYLWYRKKMLSELSRLAKVYGWDEVNESWHK